MKITILVSLFSVFIATIAAMASENTAAPAYHCESTHPELNLAPISLMISSTSQVVIGTALPGQTSQPETFTQQDLDGTPANYVRFFANVGCPAASTNPNSPRLMTCMVIRLETLMVNQAMLSGAQTSDVILNDIDYSCSLQAMAN